MIGVMPIFDFKCRVCGHQFEELVRRDDRPRCPSCESFDLARLVSVPAISTDSTRKRSMSSARRQASEVNREKKHAQAEYERNYIKDHS